MSNQMTIKQAAAQCRQYPHGCRLYGDALHILFVGYEKAIGNINPTLDELWGWVDGYLEMEEASYSPIPLG